MDFTNLHLTLEPYPTLSYRSGLVVYEESLIRGQYVGRSWNGAGYINPEDQRFDPSQHPTPQAFWLEVDGQLLASHWQWQDCIQTLEKHGLHITVSLRHSIRPISVRVHTLLDGTAVLTRWLEIKNESALPIAISAASSWSGVLQKAPRWRDHLQAGRPLYEFGVFEDTHWGHEGAFRWQALPNASLRLDGRWRRDRHRQPFFVLRNNATGEHWIGELAWSGGYAFEFDLNAEYGANDTSAYLYFRAGQDGPAPLRVLGPGETTTTPEMHLGLTFGGLDAAIQAMHDHLRRSVFMPQARGHGGWVESGIGPEQEITPERVLYEIDTAASLGAEIFFIDASWYAAPRSNWWSTVGDWQVDRQRFPDGLAPFRERAHELGMLWGLWMDAERLGSASQTLRAHPDWLVTTYGGQPHPSGLIDMSRPQVAEWLEAEIARVISSNELEFFRLDYNVDASIQGQNANSGYIEHYAWRYYDALYAIYERLRARFPDVVFENCAGGGGRSDIGMVRRFAHTWVTDWQIAPRAFSITNGMTMVLPPEYVDRLLGEGQNGHTTAELDFQARLLLFARPTVGYLSPFPAVRNPQQVGRVRHMVDLYKSFVRPFMASGRIYHHTPEVASPEPLGWGVLEMASNERDRGIAGIFQLACPTSSEFKFIPRGLDLSQRYRVTFDNSNTSCSIDGWVLMQQGITIRLEGALTSELLIFQAE